MEEKEYLEKVKQFANKSPEQLTDDEYGDFLEVTFIRAGRFNGLKTLSDELKIVVDKLDRLGPVTVETLPKQQAKVAALREVISRIDVAIQSREWAQRKIEDAERRRKEGG